MIAGRTAERERRSGFTLVEVLLVVAIIGVLATIGILSLPGRREEAMINATRGKIDVICTAVDVYEVDTGRYPPNLSALVNDDGSPNWHGPYVRGGVPEDAWGTTFQFKTTGERTYRIVSAGPDRQFGTDDDITSM
ncbi:MAG: type II secretion system protein GspG [Kiritimatiellia bacterium]